VSLISQKKSIVVETPPLNAGTYNVVINNRDSDRTGLSVEVTVVDISVQSSYFGNVSELFIQGQGFSHIHSYDCQFGNRTFPAVYLNQKLLSCSFQELSGRNSSFELHFAMCPSLYSLFLPRIQSTFEFRILQTIFFLHQSNIVRFWYQGDCLHPCLIFSDFATLGLISWKDNSIEVLSINISSRYFNIFLHSGTQSISHQIRLLQRPVIIQTLPSEVIYRNLTQSIDIHLEDGEEVIEYVTHCVFGIEELPIIHRGRQSFECRAPYRMGHGTLSVAFGPSNEAFRVTMLSVVSRPTISFVEPNRVLHGRMTTVHIFGSGFLPLSSVFCRLGNVSFLSRFISQNSYACDILPSELIGNISLRMLLNEKDFSLESFWIQFVQPFKVSRMFPSIIRSGSAVSFTLHGENFAESLELRLGSFSIKCAIQSSRLVVCERAPLFSIPQNVLFAQLVSPHHVENVSAVTISSTFENLTVSPTLIPSRGGCVIRYGVTDIQMVSWCIFFLQ